jgi:hypothetical protein
MRIGVSKLLAFDFPFSPKLEQKMEKKGRHSALSLVFGGEYLRRGLEWSKNE